MWEAGKYQPLASDSTAKEYLTREVAKPGSSSVIRLSEYSHRRASIQAVYFLNKASKLSSVTPAHDRLRSASFRFLRQLERASLIAPQT
jgi:hypothetical protein